MGGAKGEEASAKGDSCHSCDSWWAPAPRCQSRAQSLQADGGRRAEDGGQCHSCPVVPWSVRRKRNRIQFLDVAMEMARYEIIEDDGSYWGEIPGFRWWSRSLVVRT
jgi:hypothetical protein